MYCFSSSVLDTGLRDSAVRQGDWHGRQGAHCDVWRQLTDAGDRARADGLHAVRLLAGDAERTPGRAVEPADALNAQGKLLRPQEVYHLWSSPASRWWR